jgi:YqxM protein
LKKVNKITSGIIAASLLAVPFVHPGHTTLAAAIKNDQTEKVSLQNLTKDTAPQDKSRWDRSSLTFTVEILTSDGIYATIKNGEGSRAMQGEVTYEVYWTPQGNPKEGKMVATGVVNALTPGETQLLTYKPDHLVAGNYMFKAYQRPNHPGKGELWSESITVKENTDLNEQVQAQRPLDQFFNSSVDKGTATFTVPERMDPVKISYTSYAYPEGTVPQEDGKPYEGQTSFDNVTKVYGPGTYTVEVDLPHGYWQTDLYLGPEIEELKESGHPMDKIIDADYGYKN